jgi:23S rRNA (adenine2503-C2)-methyltransferase
LSAAALRQLAGLFPEELPLGGYRLEQLLGWVYGRGVTDFSQMHTLPASLRGELAAAFSLQPFAGLQRVDAEDGSSRYLFTLLDGQRTEAVYMPYAGHSTLCVSSMVGCPAACRFCATGAMGFGRNLSAAEVVGQLLAVAGDQGISPRSLRNLVFMGMGEPLLNLAQVRRAAEILLHPRALGMSARRVTLSTVGLPAKILALSASGPHLRLAISLHAPDEPTRQRIIPTAHAHPIAEILSAASAYQEATGRRISFEYSLLRGVNDHDWQADLLAELLRGLIAHVNLIPLNPWPGSPYRATSEAGLQRFLDRLALRGIPVSVRRSRGREAGAACGQLALAAAPRADSARGLSAQNSSRL